MEQASVMCLVLIALCCLNAVSGLVQCPILQLSVIVSVIHLLLSLL